MIDRDLVGVDVNRDFDSVTADTIDPRLARTEEIRDRMIARRRRAGLSDYPRDLLASDADADRIRARLREEHSRPAKVVAD